MPGASWPIFCTYSYEPGYTSGLRSVPLFPSQLEHPRPVDLNEVTRCWLHVRNPQAATGRGLNPVRYRSVCYTTTEKRRPSPGRVVSIMLRRLVTFGSLVV